jgi:E1A/CREB-binding protein
MYLTNSINETASAPIDPKIKHKQQRLLLLRHASKCPAKEGECRKTPHCWEMKKWWKHISECHDKNCKYPHCLSSRYVLMHYRRCKDADCPVCAPVRSAPDPYTDKSKPTTVKEEEPGLKRPRMHYRRYKDADYINLRIKLLEHAGASNLTEAQRRERQRNINLHIKLLEHASLCVSPNCASSNCAKMKQYLKHSKICKVRQIVQE